LTSYIVEYKFSDRSNRLDNWSTAFNEDYSSVSDFKNALEACKWADRFEKKFYEGLVATRVVMIKKEVLNR